MVRRLPLPAKLSAVILLTAILAAVFAPWVAPYSYESQNTSNALSLPSAHHWMGTDRLGRDLFSRVIYGSRVSLFVGFATTFIAIVLGTLYGGVSGYVGGKTDNVMMRVVDVVFSLPDLLLIILITRGTTG